MKPYLLLTPGPLTTSETVKESMIRQQNCCSCFDFPHHALILPDFPPGSPKPLEKSAEIHPAVVKQKHSAVHTQYSRIIAVFVHCRKLFRPFFSYPFFRVRFPDIPPLQFLFYFVLQIHQQFPVVGNTGIYHRGFPATVFSLLQ